MELQSNFILKYSNPLPLFCLQKYQCIYRKLMNQTLHNVNVSTDKAEVFDHYVHYLVTASVILITEGFRFSVYRVYNFSDYVLCISLLRGYLYLYYLYLTCPIRVVITNYKCEILLRLPIF